MGQKRGYGSMMARAKRRKFIGPIQKRPKMRGTVPRPLKAQHGADKLVIKCTRMEHHDAQLATGTGPKTIFGAMAFHELKNIWKFHRYASLYSYFKVLKMKVTFSSTPHIPTAVSCVDTDQDTTPTDTAHILMNRTARTHQLLDHKTVHSRTFNLQEIAKFRDYISCEGANTLLGEVAYKSAIRFAFPGICHPQNQNVTVTMDYVVEFCGFRDIISTDNINNPTMPTAIGPEDAPVYHDYTSTA